MAGILYPGKVNSPTTTLSAAIGAADTTIPVSDLGVFPDAPNQATIGTGAAAETILYTGKSAASGAGNLTGVTRAFQSIAQAWSAGTQIGRMFTEYDYEKLRSQFDAVSGHGHTGSTGDGPPIATTGIADGAVTTPKIADGAVTTPKIVDGAVTAAKVAADVATQAELDAKFDATTGHKHTGAAGDGPKLDPTQALTYVPVNKAGDTMDSGVFNFLNLFWGAAYTRSENVSNFDTIEKSGFYDGYYAVGAPTSTDPWYYVIHVAHTSNAPKWAMQIAMCFHDEGKVYVRRSYSTGSRVWSAWQRIWTAGNDGAGSGLDADLLDGQHGNGYVSWATVGDTIIAENLAEKSAGAQTWYDVLVPPRAGAYRITGELRHSTGVTSAMVQVYTGRTAPNSPTGGNVIATFHGSFSTTSTTYVTFTIDMAAGARVGPWTCIMISLSGGASGTAYLRNLRLRAIPGVET